MSLRPSLLAAAVALSALTATAAFADAAPANRDCFLSRDWQSWTAPGDGDTIIVRVNLHDYYAITLTPGTHVRKDPDRFLVNRLRGSSWICGPLDLDLELADHSGFRVPLIAKSLRKMAPAEVAALKPKDRP